ncbi:hypothetical protein ACH3VR_21445 [Microbacterium sp. B2969]|uniref:Terminase n=1 Tax=Microbacterium alkaliflavum TaxID=3248839 RepID=A0ABW7QDX3_9MICO
MTHGAYSDAVIDALAAEYADQVITASPVLALDRFAWSLRTWARAEARAELIHRHLAQHGIINNRGTPRTSLLVMLAASERVAARGRDELGLSPAGSAKIAALLRSAGESALSPDERRLLLGMEDGTR